MVGAMEQTTEKHVFDQHYREQTTLRDGSPVLFRLITPQDKGLLVDGLARMSADSRFRRFFSHRDHLSPSELAYLTELDHDHHFAIGAGEPAQDINPAGPRLRGLGVARFVRLEDPTIAEAAIAVVDEVQGKGLGKMLFERLVKAAAERGIRTFRFEVLAENDSMLGLVDKLFPGASRHVEDGIMTLDCPIPDLSDHPTGGAIGGTLYEVLRHAAQGTLRVLRIVGARAMPSAMLKGGLRREPPVSPPGPEATHHHSLSELIGVTEDDVPGL